MFLIHLIVSYFSMELQAGCLVRALFDYKGQTAAELSFTLGDIFYYCASEPRGWAKGEMNGKRGWFPASYVEPAPAGAAPGQKKNLPAAPTRCSVSPDSLERGSIIEDKQKITALLDSWLPSRISIHETEDNVLSKEVSKRHLLFHKIIGSKSRRPVFSVSLAELQKHGRDIPLIVIQLIAHLSQESEYVTHKSNRNIIIGLFRSSCY